MSTNRKRNTAIFLKRVTAPVVIVVLAGVVSLGIADRFAGELLDRFEHESKHTLEITTLKLDNYRDLLYAGRAFSASSQQISSSEWRTFYNQQAVFDRYPGVSSIAYATSVDTAGLAAFEAKMRTDEYYGSTFRLKSVSEREDHAFISSYVSENDLKGVEGLDLIRLDDRYEVYRSAAAKGSIVASPTMMLATGHQGFFSLLPVYKGDTLDGYVLTSFRLDGLMQELFSNESLGYSVADVTDDKPQQLYRSKSWSRDGYNYSQVLNVGGRRWNVDISDSVEQRPVGYLLPPAIMTTALILAATLYGLSGKSYRRQLRASQTE